MKRGAGLFVCLALAAWTVSLGQSVAPPVEFFSERLFDRPEEVVFVVNRDTAEFRIYYVERTCSGFSYQFRHHDDSLIVTHSVSGAVDSCEDEDRIYGLHGVITNLPAGRYRFFLMFGDSLLRKPLFMESLEISGSQ